MNLKLHTLILAMMIMISGNDSPAEDLKVGDNAPDFSMAGSDGKTYKLSDFKGKRWVVVAWFPKAFTGG
jgi:thioredoxin-dependent peroxiredoxin